MRQLVVDRRMAEVIDAVRDKGGSDAWSRLLYGDVRIDLVLNSDWLEGPGQ